MTYVVYKSVANGPGLIKLADVDDLEAGREWLANEYKDRKLVYGEVDDSVSPPAYDAFYDSDGSDTGLIVCVQPESFKII